MDVSLFGKMEKLKGISEERIMRIALRIDMKTPPRATLQLLTAMTFVGIVIC